MLLFRAPLIKMDGSLVELGIAQVLLLVPK
jgi:hypothetical protein